MTKAHISAACALMAIACWATALNLRPPWPLWVPVCLLFGNIVFIIPALKYCPRRWSGFKWKRRQS